MKRNLFFFCWGLISFFNTLNVTAQPAGRFIEVRIAPDHADWLYKTGENVKFHISVTKNDVNLKDVELRYEVSEDMMPALKKETLVLKDGQATIDAGTMKTPGFLRCQAYAKYNGAEYDGIATAGFNPEKIEPTTTLPTDFTQFWENAKAENAKIPMNPVLTLMPDRCTEKVDVYNVSLQNFRAGARLSGARLYGILCVPKAPGKYPALLKVPGAGIRPYYGDVAAAEKGFITFEIGIHGIPVNMPVGVYSDLSSGPLSGYYNFNLEDKDQYYYKRVYMGCVRAVDFIFSRPEFDGSKLLVSGGSQGGALAIISAALDPRIKGLVSFYPALSDLTGFVYGRAGGWPQMFINADKNDKTIALKIQNTKYYDVVNFARQIKVPGFYSFGYNDLVCPPTSMYSAYNIIKAPKTLMLAEETGHWTYSEQWDKSWEWVLSQIK